RRPRVLPSTRRRRSGDATGPRCVDRTLERRTLVSSAVIDASLPRVDHSEKKKKRKLPVLSVAKLLDAQRTLTAVERFARQHDADDFPRNKKYYEDLIPLERP